MSANHFCREPVLTVIIPCCNRFDLLHRCLTTVTQFAPAETQIIVIDDASPEESASRVANSFAGVKAIRLSRRSGFCIAVNHGISAARAPIVELLNDDTEVEARWAEAALACFGDSDVVAVAPLVLQLGGRAESLIDSAGDSYHLSGFARKRGHGRSLDEFSAGAGPVFGASASSAFYRRTALVDVGAFPESFGSYFDDVDVSFRLRRAGGQIVFEPRSRVWHRVGSSHVFDARLVEQQSLNEERVFWRNVPTREMWRALPLHVAALAAKAWRRWREGRLLPFVIGRLRAVAEARALFRHRRLLAKLRPDARLAGAIDTGWPSIT